MSNKLFSPRCTRARRDEIFVVGGGHVGPMTMTMTMMMVDHDEVKQIFIFIFFKHNNLLLGT